ncbi:MAG TPA: SpvB/TcaC N-terminal domain-containing protein, partial [Thermoanaerobaculia bacterium]|nr:SpvB/TcaC N-terminal domain-containing protein [Thermoanaerobaculia bacterium]
MFARPFSKAVVAAVLALALPIALSFAERGDPGPQAAEPGALRVAEWVASGHGVFTLHLDADPSSLGRAYLSYRVDGLADGAAAARSLNGLPPTGGFAAAGAAEAVVVEEIDPRWLRRGDNTLTFTATAGGSPPSVPTDLRWLLSRGAAGGGATYEVREPRLLLTAGKATAAAAPRLVVSLLRGEERGAYLRGFLAPHPTVGEAAELFVDGRHVAGALAAGDGGFEVYVPRGDSGTAPQRVEVEVVFADGSRLTRRWLAGRRVAGAAAGRAAATELRVAPGEEKALELDGARLVVDRRAVGREVKLSMRALAGHQVPPMNGGMYNVTAPHAGLRMGPHGMRFARPVRFEIPFAPELLPQGTTAEDVRTFYFDEASGRWVALPRLTVDAAAGRVVSATDHFTDFVNAVLVAPDEPAAPGFAPNSLSELASADPTSGLTLVEPPAATSSGDAELAFPLVVPPGRLGMEPQLALTYSSGGGNGWLGLGWDLALPAVEVSTLFGVPRYAADRESESYALDGALLAPADGSAAGPRQAGRRFVERVEGSFSRIVRHGATPRDHWWEVTNKDGVRFEFGRSAAARLAAPHGGEVFRWNLETMVDPHGNRVDYEYRTDRGSDGEDWVQLYPRRIAYTAGPGVQPFYEVRFLLDDEVAGTVPRLDRLSSGLAGFKTATRRRLERVEVRAGGAVVRAYDLVYAEGAFAKTLLSEIVARGEGGEVEFFRHRFDYQPLGYREPGVVDGFSAPREWGRLGADDDQSDHLAIGGGFHAFAGLGPPTCVGGHAGVQGGFSFTDDTLRTTLLDADGDGLPDRVREDGRVELNSVDGGFTGRAVSVDGATAFGHTENWAFDFGLGAHSPTETGQLGVSWVWTHANDDRAVADVDGDLRPDLVSTTGGFSWRRNTGAGFEPPRGGSGFSLAGLDLEAAGEQAELEAAYHPVDTLLELRLPYGGEVEISGAARRKEPGGDGVEVSIHHGSRRVWSHRIEPDDSAACAPADDGGCGGGLRVTVDAGESLYFRSRILGDVEHDAVEWAPVVAYDVAEPLLAEREAWGSPVYLFDQAADFRLAGRPGGGWTASAAGRVTVEGDLDKEETADHVELRVERIRAVGDEVEVETVHRETFAADRQGRFTPSIDEIEVAAGDVLTFQLGSVGQVEPRRLAWAPVVTYEGGEYCRQPYAGGAPVCGSVSCTDGADGTCTFSGDPRLVVRRGDVRRPAGVEVHVALHHALSGPTVSGAVEESVDDGDLVLGWERAEGSLAPVTLLIQGEHRLHARCEVVAGQTLAFCTAADVRLAAGERVYFTVVGPATATRRAGGVLAGELVAANLRSPYGAPLSGGFHGWFHGEWNGDLPFDVNEFEDGAVRDRRENEQPPAWGAATPAPAGTDDHPGPVWVGSGHGFHLAAGEMKPARFGASVGPLLAGANGGDGPSLLRKTTGRTEAVSAGFFAGASLSLGFADTQLDLLDMNADGYVDQVSEGRVRFSDGRAGFGAAEAIENFAGSVRRVEDANLMLGVTVGVPYGVKNGSALSRAARSTAPSVGQTTSLAQTRRDLVDVNGDGLPDRVELTPGAVAMTVRLNLGYRFGEAEQWPLEPWAERSEPRCQEGLDFATAPLLDAIAGVGDPNALSLTTSAAYDVGLAFGWFGGGVNTTLSRTLVELADVNGDGLVDHVAKDDGESFFRVKLNLGDRWAAEERWYAPDWTTSLGDGYDPGISHAGARVFNCFDAVSLYGDLGGLGSIGVPICIPLVPPIPVVALYFELAGQVFGGEGGLQLELEDVDGDGLVDHVLKKGGDGAVHVRRNQVGQTNLLTTVHRPLGGRVDLTYRRQGNRVDSVPDGAAGTRPIDLPFHHWVLATATVDDGRGNAYTRAFDYFDDGYYDRGERLFYGFRHVRETLPDGSRFDTFFHNDDFHLRGLPFRETVADAAGNLFRVDEWRYETRPLTAAAAFPALVEEATHLYDGTTASPAGFGKQTRLSHDYDAAGNPVASRDFADEGVDDDVVVTTAWSFDEASHLTLPRLVEVRDAEGTLLRRQRFVHDERGSLVTMQATLDGGRDPETGSPYADDAATWSWSYDARGMQVAATDPVGYTVTSSYDPLTGSYPVAVRDSFGYGQTSTWDPAHGLLVEATDANGETARWEHDAFGRLVRTFGPYDAAGSPLVTFAYAPGASPPYAVAHHKDVTRGDPITSAVFVDALGRVLQVRTDTEIDRGSGSSGRLGVEVAGSVRFDVKGRVAASGQPYFEAAPVDRFAERPLVHPTAYEYDAVDRPLAVRYPHGAETRIAYGFAPLDGVGRIATDRFDANDRRTRRFLHVDGSLLGVEQRQGGRPIVTRYDYDPLSQLVRVTDAAGNATRLDYDTLGRRVAVDQPDAGRVEMRWDRGGNLGAQVSARLAARGEQIRYHRTFHRLDRVDYPQKTDAAYTWGPPGAPEGGAGRIVAVDDESGRETFAYGRRGEVVRTTKSATALNGVSPKGPYELAYEYDSFDRLLAIAYPDGERVEYGFDAGGRVKSASGELRGRSYPYLTHLGYDAFGQPVRLVYGNGAETRFAYDPESRFATRRTTRSGGRVLQDLAFENDPVGTLVGVDNEVPVPRPNEMGGPSSQRFAYDDLYQLVAASGEYRTAPNRASRYELALAYDDVGNLTAKRQQHVLVAPGGPAIEQRKTSYDWRLDYEGPQPHAPTQVGERSFAYDADGQQLGWDHDANGSRRGNSWDDAGSLASLSDNGRTTRYLYDASGLRTNKAGADGETIYVGRWFSVRNGTLGTKHLFADDHRLASKLGQPSLQAAPGGGNGKGSGKGNGNGGGRPVEEKLYFYHGDHVGSTQFVTDADGEVYQHLEYFPQGEPWVDERAESERTPYLFAAQELDEESGLMAIGVRYLDPRQGQWLSPDPSYEGMLDPGDFSNADPSLTPFRLPGHMYAYAANSPTGLVDANGLDYTDIAGDTTSDHRTRFNRVIELHGKLLDTTKKRRRGAPATTEVPFKMWTTALAYDPATGTSYVASNRDKLGDPQRAALTGNEWSVTTNADPGSVGHQVSVAGRLGSGKKAHHAERKAFEAAVANGANPADVVVYSSREPCPGCQSFRVR